MYVCPGMAFVLSYAIVIVTLHPYIYSQHQRLHLLAQTELFLFLSSGYLFAQGEWLGTANDPLMSTFLLVATLGFIFVFFQQVWFRLFKLFTHFYQIYQRWRERRNGDLDLDEMTSDKRTPEQIDADNRKMRDAEDQFWRKNQRMMGRFAVT